MMGRQSPSAALSERERKSIAAAIAAGVPIKHLVRSGRWPGITDTTMSKIADAAGVPRKRCPKKGAK